MLHSAHAEKGFSSMTLFVHPVRVTAKNVTQTNVLNAGINTHKSTKAAVFVLLEPMKYCQIPINSANLAGLTANPAKMA